METTIKKLKLARDKAAAWYEHWAEKYNRALESTFVQSNLLGNQSLAKFFGYFVPYEDVPDVTAQLAVKQLWVVSAWDVVLNRPRLTNEYYNKKALARLRKIEKKLAEWRVKYDDAADLWK